MPCPAGDANEGVASAVGVKPLTVVAPPLPTEDHQPERRKEGADPKEAKWFPGRRRVVRGPELWKHLKERLRNPNGPAFRSGWQDVDLVWRVLRVLVVKLDLGAWNQ